MAKSVATKIGMFLNLNMYELFRIMSLLALVVYEMKNFVFHGRKSEMLDCKNESPTPVLLWTFCIAYSLITSSLNTPCN